MPAEIKERGAGDDVSGAAPVYSFNERSGGILALRQTGLAPTAVHEQRLAGNTAGFIRGQEENAVANLLRRKQTLHGDDLHDVLNVDDTFVDPFLDHLRHDITRCDAIDPDIESGPLHTQGRNKAVDCGLGDVIGAALAGIALGIAGGNADDAATACFCI